MWPPPHRLGEKDQLTVSRLFLWYGGDFGPDSRAVIEWIAGKIPAPGTVLLGLAVCLEVTTLLRFQCAWFYQISMTF